MKKLLLIFILMHLVLVSVQASHIQGYEMSLLNIKTSNGAATDSYKWRMKIYRDLSGNPMPASITFNVYSNEFNILVGTFTVTKINPQTYYSAPSTFCFPPVDGFTLEYGLFESPAINYSNLNDINNYYVSATNCCRAPGIKNMKGASDAYGITFTMDFPRLDATAPTRYNSSPVFNIKPIPLLGVGVNHTLDWSAVDYDGDSLAYSVVKSFNELSEQKPFVNIDLASGYKLDSNIVDGNPDFKINPRTGMVYCKPMQNGKYVVTVKVDEYRKLAGVQTKIGTVYRDFQFQTVYLGNVSPTITDLGNRIFTINDTIDYNDEYVLDLKANDLLGDSIFMYALPTIAAGENLFDNSLYGAEFGVAGNLLTGTAATNLVLKGKTNLYGQFKWNPKCKNVRSKPYSVKFVVKDKNINCSNQLVDTLHVNIYVRKKPNSPPMFISPDTIINNKVLKYYVKQNTLFQLNADSILKTYDQDSTQVVNITIISNPNNPSPDIFSFSANPSLVNSTATFSRIYTCTQNAPYRYTFVAFDDDCLKRDTAYLNIEVYVLPEFVAAENICGITVDTSLNSNLIFWQRNDSTISRYVLFKENSVTAQYDSMDTISANTMNFYFDLNSNYGNYKLAALNSCGNKSLQSNIASNVSLGSRVVNSDVVDLNWSPYLNAEQNDSFIVAVKTDLSMSYKEIARLPITQMQFTDSLFFNGFAYYRIEVKSDITCLSPNVLRPRIFSNSVRCAAESVSIFNGIQFNIHPNPTSNIINVSGLPENQLNDLFIFDVLGKQVYTQKVQGTAVIDLSGLSKGVYFVRVGASTRRLIRN